MIRIIGRHLAEQQIHSYSARHIPTPKPDNRPIALIDCGSQFTDRILDIVRSQGFRIEVVDQNISPEELKKRYGALIVSGSGKSVDEPGAPTINKDILDGSIPVLGICYGMQLISYLKGGKIIGGKREEGVYGVVFEEGSSPVLDGLKSSLEMQLTHGDSVDPNSPGEGMEVIAKSVNGVVSMIKNAIGNIIGIQGHPEVHSTPKGAEIFHNFLTKVAKLTPGAPETTEKLTERLISEIREKVGDKEVLVYVSGGVDSTVVLALLQKALAPDKLGQIKPVFINNGFMREGEVEMVRRELKEATGLDIQVIEATEDFLNATTIIDGKKTPPLREVTAPEMKRKIIGDYFMDIQAKMAQELGLKPDYLLAQGTLSTDMLESGGGNTSTIKTHHNLTEKTKKLRAEGKLLEPLISLLKDGVRKVGKQVGLADHMVYRNPFPGPGIAIRIVCAEEADTKYFSYLTPQIQSVMSEHTDTHATLLPVKAVGVAGDDRIYSNIVVLSSESSPNWSELMSIREKLTKIPAKKDIGLLGNAQRFWKRLKAWKSGEKWKDTKESTKTPGVCRVLYAFGKQIHEEEIHEITPTHLGHDTTAQVRHADAIVHEEFRKAGILKFIKQTPVVSLPVDLEKKGGRSIVIRPFKSEDFKTGEPAMPGTDEMPESLLAIINDRILAEVPGISRVLYDLTPKPPGTTEFE